MGRLVERIASWKAKPALEMEQGVASSNKDSKYGVTLYSGKSGPLETEEKDKQEYDDDGRPARTGTFWTASAHVITAVIGSGVLSLAWSISQLGWVAGPLILLAFAGVTYITSIMLADCYRSPDPITGKRNYTYMEAIRANLGGYQVFLCGLVQYVNLYGVAIGYTITSSVSLVAIQRANCFHKDGHESACTVSNNFYMTGFGICQVFFSQIPDFSEISWLSIVAAVMSFTYSGIGLGLSVAKAAEHGHSHGTLTGVPVGTGPAEVTQQQKIFSMMSALGNMAFSYGFSTILLNIQDTLKSPPSENKTMKKATLVGIITTTVFYLSVGCAGYAAFGNQSPGDLLTDFGFFEPFWLVDFANICIVVHLVGAYQVFSQPLFAFVENWAANKWPKNTFITKEGKVKVPLLGTFRVNGFRLVWRTAYVVSTTLIALLLPFFNAIMGLLGAAGFWPLAVYFPVTIYIKQKAVSRWSGRWISLQIMNVVCFIVTLAAAAGSIENILRHTKHYKPFA